jgi:hypothetical protein
VKLFLKLVPYVGFQVLIVVVTKGQQVKVICKDILNGLKCKYANKLSGCPLSENITKAYMPIIIVFERRITSIHILYSPLFASK